MVVSGGSIVDTTQQDNKTVVTQTSLPGAGYQTVRTDSQSGGMVDAARLDNQTVVTQTPLPNAGLQTVRTDSHRTTRISPQTSEVVHRIGILTFGLIELVIGARIVLLLLGAHATQGLVSLIYSVSGLFVAPFNGILNADYLKSAGSVLDVAAVLALVGWLVLELVIFWAVAIFAREPDTRFN
jgi:hypothetical protein